MEISALVREARHALGLSQAKLSRLMCVDVSTVKRWERGEAVQGIALAALSFALRASRVAPASVRNQLVHELDALLYPE